MQYLEFVEPLFDELIAEHPVILVLQEETQLIALEAEVLLQSERDIDLGVLSPLAPNVLAVLLFAMALECFGVFGEEVRRRKINKHVFHEQSLRLRTVDEELMEARWQVSGVHECAASC